MKTHPGRRPGLKALGAIATLAVLLFGSVAIAGDGDAAELARRLAKLRSQVETLSSQVENKKADIDAHLRSIRSQKADLEMQVEREKTRLQQLRQAVEKHRARIEAQKQTRADLEPTVSAAVADVRQTVADSLPFKRSARLAELDKIEKQLKGGLISPQKAAARLWQFVEDELRLTRENGLYRQIVQVDGDEVLADVARVGMVAIYFKTDDGRVGMARRADDGWTWKKLDDEQDKKRVANLFDAFKKNIRVGFFEIPNAFPAQTKHTRGAK